MLGRDGIRCQVREAKRLPLGAYYATFAGRSRHDPVTNLSVGNKRCPKC